MLWREGSSHRLFSTTTRYLLSGAARENTRASRTTSAWTLRNFWQLGMWSILNGNKLILSLGSFWADGDIFRSLETRRLMFSVEGPATRILRTSLKLISRASLARWSTWEGVCPKAEENLDFAWGIILSSASRGSMALISTISAISQYHPRSKIQLLSMIKKENRYSQN